MRFLLKDAHCLPLCQFTKCFPVNVLLVIYNLLLFSSKGVKTQLNTSVFGSLQNFKEDKAKPVRDEYEYVSDDGELKIDEFPIRRKKNTTKRELPCKSVSILSVSVQRILCVDYPKLVFKIYVIYNKENHVLSISHI